MLAGRTGLLVGCYIICGACIVQSGVVLAVMRVSLNFRAAATSYSSLLAQLQVLLIKRLHGALLGCCSCICSLHACRREAGAAESARGRPGSTLLNSSDPFYREFRDLPYYITSQRCVAVVALLLHCYLAMLLYRRRSQPAEPAVFTISS